MYGMISVIEKDVGRGGEVASIDDSLLASAAMPGAQLVDCVSLQLSKEPRPEGEPSLLARIVTAAIVAPDQDENALEEGVAQNLAVGLRQPSGRRRARDRALDQTLYVLDDFVLAKRLEGRASLGDPPDGEQGGHQAASLRRALRK